MGRRSCAKTGKVNRVTTASLYAAIDHTRANDMSRIAAKRKRGGCDCGLMPEATDGDRAAEQSTDGLQPAQSPQLKQCALVAATPSRAEAHDYGPLCC